MRTLTQLSFLAALMLLWGCTQDLEDQTSANLVSQDDQRLMRQIIEETEAAMAEARAEIAQEEAIDRSGNTVSIPAPSSGALAAAIAEAGPNGTVILEAGQHSESGPVMITHRVTLRGEPGAVLTIDCAPANFLDVPVVLNPAIRIQDADHTRIEGLEIRPGGENGKVAILVEDSRRVRITDNTFFGFQLSVFLYGADNAVLNGNYMEGLQEPEFHYGVMVMQGRNVKIFDNEITRCGTGVFTSDRNGMAFENYFHDNLGDGIILCNAPAFYALPGGPIIQAPEPTNGWVVAKNISNGNGELGYSIIDGSHNNQVINNSAADNGLLGIVLFPDLDFPGLFLPAVEDNVVISIGAPDVTIMDCGVNNNVIGGTMIDCFL